MKVERTTQGASCDGMTDNGSRVLVVDDDAWVRSAVSKYFSSEGVDYDICSDPEDAVAQCIRTPARYGLVLLDIRFPEGDLGFDASRRIMEACPDAPPVIIGMTAHRDVYDRDELAKVGMSDVLVKPLFKWLVINLAREHCERGAA